MVIDFHVVVIDFRFVVIGFPLVGIDLHDCENDFPHRGNGIYLVNSVRQITQQT